MNKEKLLADALNIYIKEHHTQEECVGFIAGFEIALNISIDNSLKEDATKDLLNDVVNWNGDLSGLLEMLRKKYNAYSKIE